MVEEILRDYLAEVLTVPVYMEIPANPPDRFAVVEKTGSARKALLNSAMIAIKSYGDTLYHAAQLNEQVKTAMDGAIVLDAISSVALNSDYNFTDTATKRYRYQAVYDITYYQEVSL